jgi:hypothetical protein
MRIGLLLQRMHSATWFYAGCEGDGRGARIRTEGLLLPKQARYRAAPHPV